MTTSSLQGTQSPALAPHTPPHAPPHAPPTGDQQTGSTGSLQGRAQPRSSKPWRRWLRRGVLLAVVGGTGALVVVAALPKPVLVDVARVVRGPMRVTVDEDGRARVKDRHVISAPLSGNVGRIEHSPGDEVKAGAVLARLVPLSAPLLDERTRLAGEARVAGALAAQQQARAQILRARTAAEYAQRERERSEQLAKAGALTPQDLEAARMRERTATAELESLHFAAKVADYEVQMARAALGHLSRKPGTEPDVFEVLSPVSGRVLQVMRQSEGAVVPGAPLLEVGSPEALEVVADVLTSDAVAIRPGAQVEVDGWGGATLDARVRLVEPSAFTRVSALGVEEQRVNVVLDLVSPRSSWTALGDGYRVEVHIVVWQTPATTQLPASAVFRHASGWAAYAVEGGHARLRSVQLGHRTGSQVELRAGLPAGTTVVAHPSDRVGDGVAVEAR